jgi:hypothetical protein
MPAAWKKSGVTLAMDMVGGGVEAEALILPVEAWVTLRTICW